MSWRTGASILVQIWPTVKEEITDKEHLLKFGKELYQVFDNNDIDFMDVLGEDEDLDKIIKAVYELPDI